MTETPGSDKLYGALLENEAAVKAMNARGLGARRRRFNCVPLLLALLLPWVLFCCMFALSAFYLSYTAPGAVRILQGTLSLGCFKLLYSAWENRSRGLQEGFYPVHLSLALLVATLLGGFSGTSTYAATSGPIYAAENMATYADVDPSSITLASGEVRPTRGARYMDAGKVYFKSDTALDISKSMSFKSGDIYCVAPIVNPNCKKNCGNDFWAVGINCCSEDKADFHCGEYNSKNAKSGIRMLSDTQRPYYRMAVLQAESARKVTSPHPVFFEWVQDPLAVMQEQKRAAFSQFVLWMFAFFFANAGALGLSLKYTPALAPYL